MSNDNKRVLSVEDCEKVRGAFQVLHSVFASQGVSLPAFAALTTDQYATLATGAIRGLAVAEKARKEQARAQFRQAVNAKITEFVDAANVAKAEFDALSPTLRALMPKFPNEVRIPLAKMSDIFSPGATVDQVAVLLKDMDYNMMKTKEKNSEWYILAPLAAKTETK